MLILKVSEQHQLPKKVKSLLHQSIERVLQLKLAIIQPIIQSASDSVEAIIMTMHDDDFSQYDFEYLKLYVELF